jgi:hypothetical protein
MENSRSPLLKCFSGLALILSGMSAGAQALPVATRDLTISVFAGGTGNYTGLRGGRNLDITAGLDLNFRPIHSTYLSLEGRGSYPVNEGKVDRQKNALGGVKLSRNFGSLYPYVDVLFGRGAINYEQRFATPDPRFYYLRSVSNVLAAGVGVDLALSPSFLVKVDGQIERYNTPVTQSGHLYSKPITLGLVYRFSFGR